MKNIGKILALFLVLASFVSTLAVPASAVTIKKKQVAYLTGDFDEVFIDIENMKQGEAIKKGSIKSSNKTVLVPEGCSYSTSVTRDAADKITGLRRSCTITLNPKKPGTAKVSFIIGKRTYTTTVTIKKYTNPLKTLTIPGVKSGKNLASAFHKTINASTTLKRDGKKGNLVVQTKKGWVISYLGITTSARPSVNYVYAKRSLSKVSVPLPAALKKNKSCIIDIGLYHVRDEQTVHLSYEIN